MGRVSAHQFLTLKKFSKILLKENFLLFFLYWYTPVSILFGENKLFVAPAFPVESVVDPTGAGDSFAGGVIGYIAKYGLDNPVEAVVHGSAVASYTVSGFGLEQLLKLNQKELNHRINQVSFR